MRRLDELLEQGDTSLVIHYSCESFYGKTDGKTPRITSIAVRNLRSGQTESFSIHQVAEERHIPFADIDASYDALERQMLDRFFEFVRVRPHCNWIHWNMRDVNYGFAALEHRYRVLGGMPVQIAEDRKFDLARALVDIYGIGYISHPRFESLIKKNKITDRDFLNGEQEAEAFERKEFVRLHQSTLRKADILPNVFERTVAKTLKTNATWREQHGFSVAVLGELAREHWIVAAFIAVGAALTVIVRALDLWSRFGGSGGP